MPPANCGLFSPLELRQLLLSNRIIVSPMCQYSSVDGNAADWHVVNLGQNALSGPGLVFTEATAVSPAGRISPADLGLYSDANETALERVVAFVRRWTRTPIGIQLAHAGRKASTAVPWDGGGPLEGSDAWETLAPSAIPHAPGWHIPRALDGAGMQQVCDEFVAAARRADRLGFDAIELHFAHGYLLHQFLSPIANQRTDEYGGSRENRMRFPLHVFEAVRAVWPEERPLGVRISASDYVEGGWNVEDSIALANELCDRSCDFIDCSGGGVSPAQRIELREGYQVPFARAIRAATGAVTIAVGLMSDPAYADAVIARGDADAVAIARGFIRNPRWTWDAADALGAQSFVPPQYERGRTSHQAHAGAAVQNATPNPKP